MVGTLRIELKSVAYKATALTIELCPIIFACLSKLSTVFPICQYKSEK